MKSDTEKTQGTAAQPSTLGRMFALLLMAVVLGRAFNSANPLGVHGSSAAAKIPLAGAKSAGSSAPRTSAGASSTYENQTLSLSLETEGTNNLPPGDTAQAAPQPSEQAALPLPNVPTLTWPETKKLSESGQALLVDARAATFYQTDHIPGAVSFPAGSPAQDVSDFVAKYPKNTAIIVYCGSLQCPLSEKLVAQLTGQLGYTNVREMPGGFAEFRQWESRPQKQGGVK
jgi:rhodanese-related sulfurtransferase